MAMDIYEQIAVKIVAGQETIIGPVAVEQAQRVSHLKLDWGKHEAAIDKGNGVETLEGLIKVYQELFGQISVEVSRQSAATLLSQLADNQLPAALK